MAENTGNATPFHAETLPGADSHRVVVVCHADGSPLSVSSPDRCAESYQLPVRGPACAAPQPGAFAKPRQVYTVPAWSITVLGRKVAHNIVRECFADAKRWGQSFERACLCAEEMLHATADRPWDGYEGRRVD